MKTKTKNMRNYFIEIREGFLDEDSKVISKISYIISYIMLIIALIIMYCLSFFMYIVNFSQIAMLINGIFIFGCIILILNKIPNKIMEKLMEISYSILIDLFGKYGRVMSPKDWKYIKKVSPRLYRYQKNKRKYYGHCYDYSRYLAYLVDDAELLYCSIEAKNKMVAHAVILKGEWIYDTNIRLHIKMNDFVRIYNAEIYKKFPKEVFEKRDFFNSIREDFINWCNQNNVDVDF